MSPPVSGAMMQQAQRRGHRAAARYAWASLLLALVVGCASFPHVAPMQREAAGVSPRVVGTKGPLTRQQSAAILAKLQQQGGVEDILAQHIALEEAVSGSPLVAGNKVTLLRDGPETYRAMFEAMARARDTINLETYIFEDDEIGRRFAEALLKHRARGVQVNVIYDSLGSIKAPRAFFEELKAGGVQVLEFSPVNPLAVRKDYAPVNRDHRKLLIVDGRIVFVGGINISSVYSSSPSSGRSARASRSAATADEASKAGEIRAGGAKDVPWRDTHARIEGPVTREFQKLFLETWSSQHGDPLPERRYLPDVKADGNQLVRALASQGDQNFSPIYVTFVSAINTAQKSIDITMAYFLPDEQLLEAITEAARRGVTVRMVMPGQSDFWAVFHAGRSRYQRLLEAGVQVYERKDALLHAKTLAVDGVWSTIGSSNLDPLSFLHNNEANCVVLGAEFGAEMKAMFDDDVRVSRPITLETWRQRPIGNRLREWAARAWEYWM